MQLPLKLWIYREDLRFLERPSTLQRTFISVSPARIKGL